LLLCINQGINITIASVRLIYYYTHTHTAAAAERVWTATQFHGPFLGGKHVLRVTVVVGVALEAVTQTGAAVACAAVGALADVLVGRLLV